MKLGEVNSVQILDRLIWTEEIPSNTVLCLQFSKIKNDTRKVTAGFKLKKFK